MSDSVVDWTADPETGASNTSPEFRHLVEEVSRLIREAAHALLAGQADTAARLIMARLAHVHGLAPASLVRAVERERCASFVDQVAASLKVKAAERDGSVPHVAGVVVLEEVAYLLRRELGAGCH